MGKAVRSGLENSTPAASTKARGGAAPIRAMIRSHLSRDWPWGVSTVIQPGSTNAVLVSVSTLIRPASRAANRPSTLGFLAVGKSAPRFTRVTVLF